MGAAFDPSGDTSCGDRGGSSLAATRSAPPELTPAALSRPTPTPGPSPGGDVRRGADTTAFDSTVPSPGPASPIPITTWRRCPTTRELRSKRDRRLSWVHRYRPGRDQPRAHAGGGPAHGATVRLRVVDPARAALCGGQPREGGPGAPNLRRAHARTQSERPAGRGRRQRPTRPRTGVLLSRRRVGRRVFQRARCPVRLDVRRRVRQRQPRLPASRRAGVLGTPQGHPRQLRLRCQPGHGRRHQHDGRHPQRRPRGYLLGGHAGRREHPRHGRSPTAGHRRWPPCRPGARRDRRSRRSTQPGVLEVPHRAGAAGGAPHCRPTSSATSTILRPSPTSSASCRCWASTTPA